MYDTGNVNSIKIFYPNNLRCTKYSNGASKKGNIFKKLEKNLSCMNSSKQQTQVGSDKCKPSHVISVFWSSVR